MSKKSTNFELLRILLTIFIPLYHWFLYNGIFYAENSMNNLIALGLFSGIPFTCMYAFIVMSSYFLVKKKSSWSIHKVFSFLALCLTLFVFKNIIIHTLFWGWKMNYYVDSFFLKGAWWYIYPYILIMFFYPLLNRFIYYVSLKVLYGITAVLGGVFIYNIVINNTCFINDCIMFLLIYFIIGCNERHKENQTMISFYSKHKTIILITIYIIAIALPAILSVHLKHPSNTMALETSNAILQKVHGRYTLAGLIGGIAIFTFFKDIHVPYKPIIHEISKITLFVFLLHETVMSVFWYFEIKSCEYLAYLPAAVFWGFLLLYMIFCIIGAFLIYKAYYLFFAALWEKCIAKLCETNIVKQLENNYKKLLEK